VRFVDFAIRAWREGPYVQVIAHSTPAGALRQPVAVKLGKFVADDFRIAIDAPLADAAEIGRALARLVFPPEIWRLLGESLAGIGARPEGTPFRLCLDDDLIDLPWEFLYRPDGDAPAAQSGFLLTDGSISLTREPPSIVGAPCVRSSNFAPSTSRSAGACRGIPVRPPGDSLSQRRAPPLHHGPGNPECSRDAARAVEAACGDRLRTGSPESPLSRFGALIAGARPRA
jgi:hypothetical protein